MITKVVSVLVILFIASFVSATNNYTYTSDQYCLNSKDVFLEGEDVYLKINLISEGVHPWFIKGLGSCNNQTISRGYFGIPSVLLQKLCFNMDVAKTNCEEYEILVVDDIYGNMTTRYSVVSTPIIPEFGLLVGVITVLGAIFAFFLIRRN